MEHKLQRFVMKYRKGYKYQLAEDYEISIDIYGYDIDVEFIRLTPKGKLQIRSGYAWDGASGVAIDTENFMEGSLVHDALYQLLRYGLLPSTMRLSCDAILIDICEEAGMWKIRQWWVEKALKKFGDAAANPKNKKKIYEV